MTGSPSSPTVRRWELAARLRQLRLEAGLSVEQVAAHLMCSPAKVSRLETAVRGASPRDVRDLCTLYDIGDDEREHLMSLARDAKERSWWQEYSALETAYATYIGLEAAASAILDLQPLLLPGLLQTPSYARALVRGINPAGLPPSRDVEERVAVRVRRQAVLAADPGPRLHFLVDESALRRRVATAAVMREQLRHLLGLSERPNLTLQVVPLSKGSYPGLEGGFIVLQFDERQVADSVYVEGLAGQLFIDRPEDVERFLACFDHVASRVALTAARSRSLMHAISREIG